MTETNGNQQAASVLFIHAQTPVHPGAGTALGVVDMPVQRERHTQWPLIPGTSLKGVLRDTARTKTESDQVADAFGPDTRDADKHAGAITVTDARLLAFPVRSLRGVFAWVTCPSVLERFNRDIQLAGLDPVNLEARPADNEALSPKNCPLVLDGEAMVLEEFDFKIKGDATSVALGIAKLAFPPSTPTADTFCEKLVVLSDNDFTHFARHATEVVARIGLDPTTKTAAPGALFYQEFLPTETLFYSVVIANRSRGGLGRTAQDVLHYIHSTTPDFLQIGGDETTGKGLCAVHFAGHKE